MSDLDRDLAEMKRLGYGNDYGRYKADHPGCPRVAQHPAKEKLHAPPVKYEKTCAFCGKTFSTDQAGKIYCSDPCHDAAARKRYYQRKAVQKVLTVARCAICGAEFVQLRGTHKYCSPECNRAGNRVNQSNWRARLKEAQNGACV